VRCALSGTEENLISIFFIAPCGGGGGEECAAFCDHLTEQNRDTFLTENASAVKFISDCAKHPNDGGKQSVMDMLHIRAHAKQSIERSHDLPACCATLMDRSASSPVAPDRARQQQQFAVRDRQAGGKARAR
jgi:hypothetical protein